MHSKTLTVEFCYFYYSIQLFFFYRKFHAYLGEKKIGNKSTEVTIIILEISKLRSPDNIQVRGTKKINFEINIAGTNIYPAKDDVFTEIAIAFLLPRRHFPFRIS